MLSAYGYRPPIETVIVPRIETAVAAGLAPSRKRRAQWELFPPYIVYPPPPTFPPVKVPLTISLTAVARMARLWQDVYFSLRAPVVVNPFVPPAPPVETTITVVGSPAIERMVANVRRRTMAGVRPPRFVSKPTTFNGFTWNARTPRQAISTHYRLAPPVDVTPAPPAAVVFYEAPLRRVSGRRAVMWIQWPPQAPLE